MYERFTDDMIKRFELYFPTMSKQAIRYKADSPSTLIIELNDGDVILWDDDDTSFRHLPSDSNNMTEVQCRREFSHRLRRIMLHKGVTQMDLSTRTGIPQSQISKYASGKALPGFYNVDRIAKALNCSADELRYNG